MDVPQTAEDGGSQSRSMEADSEPPSCSEPEQRVRVDASARLGPSPSGIDPLDTAWIESRLLSVLDLLDREADVEAATVRRIEVRIVDDVEMESVHVRFSGEPGTTDVLAFPIAEEGFLDLDVFACLDEARRRSAEFGHPVEQELLLYAVHGLLHGLGHDDHDPEGHALMHAEEDRLLALVGVGATYRPGGGS